MRTVVFGAVGTAGQRCTTTRRLFLHESVAKDFIEKLKNAYQQVKIGDPLQEGTLMGPVHSQMAVDMYKTCLEESKAQGGEIVLGERPVQHSSQGLEGGFWLSPAIVYHGKNHPKVMEEETFAPILRECPNLLSPSCIGAHRL